MSNEQPKTATEEVQKPAELSAEELEKAAGSTPTDPCNKIEKALPEKDLDKVSGGAIDIFLRLDSVTPEPPARPPEKK